MSSAWWTEAMATAFAETTGNRVRSLLTIAAVAVGVSGVAGVGAVIAGLDRAMSAQLENLGSSIILVRARGPEHLAPAEARRRRGLSLRETRAVAARCAAVRAVAPIERLSVESVKYGNEEVEDVWAMGTWAEYAVVHDVLMARGRFLTAAEVRHRARVVVLGHELGQILFSAEDPIGKLVAMDGVHFRVVGVMSPRGRLLDLDWDRMLAVPLGAFAGAAATTYLVDVQPKSPALFEAAITQIRGTLRAERRLPPGAADTFEIVTQSALSDLYVRFTAAAYALMLAVSSIGLVVGAVGVLNVSLISVAQRIREIGLRKALGATRRQIWGQFLIESTALAAIGGLLGVVLGGGAAWVTRALLGFPAAVSPGGVAIALATAIAVGVTASVGPAMRAAAVDPADALRHE